MGKKERVILGGFTLIELLMVIVIIAILSSIAIPTYIKTVEKARAGEAITILNLIRAGEKIYKLERGWYSADLLSESAISAFLNLNVEPEFWEYKVAGSATATFTATAIRDSGLHDGAKITIDQDGFWDGNSDFVPSN